MNNTNRGKTIMTQTKINRTVNRIYFLCIQELCYESDFIYSRGQTRARESTSRCFAKFSDHTVFGYLRVTRMLEFGEINSNKNEKKYYENKREAGK